MKHLTTDLADEEGLFSIYCYPNGGGLEVDFWYWAIYYDRNLNLKYVPQEENDLIERHIRAINHVTQKLSST